MIHALFYTQELTELYNSKINISDKPYKFSNGYNVAKNNESLMELYRLMKETQLDQKLLDFEQRYLFVFFSILTITLQILIRWLCVFKPQPQTKQRDILFVRTLTDEIVKTTIEKNAFSICFWWIISILKYANKEQDFAVGIFQIAQVFNHFHIDFISKNIRKILIANDLKI